VRLEVGWNWSALAGVEMVCQNWVDALESV
jgi:hypothetical protein